MASVKNVSDRICKAGRVECGKEGIMPGLQKEILKEEE